MSIIGLGQMVGILADLALDGGNDAEVIGRDANFPG